MAGPISRLTSSPEAPRGPHVPDSTLRSGGASAPRHASKLAAAVAVRRCPQCRETKPLNSEYWHTDRRTRSGYRWRCRRCQNAWRRNYFEGERGRLKRKRFAEAHPNKGKEYRNRYYQRNPKDNSRIRWARANRDRARASALQSYRRGMSVLSASYVSSRLCRNGISRENITPEMIELKRAIIQLKRAMKEAITNGKQGNRH